jgi:hypothetical protein
VILFIGGGLSVAHRTAARVLSKGLAEGRYGCELGPYVEALLPATPRSRSLGYGQCAHHMSGRRSRGNLHVRRAIRNKIMER